ncbi:hypothetical protein [Lentzea aerocolonigenes]|uniref:hypothetical protein n=1 Tax=Lentzea aerocolonigenes TaxID=68170 RepID=UPI0018C8A7BC|nr:hypothetical protein [Lentzea aerocolonigenes]
MHIPEALYQDTKELPVPRSALVVPAAVFPLLVVLLPLVTSGAILDLHWGWWVGGMCIALGWSVAAGFIARSPKPWASTRRMLGWLALWCIEPFAALPLFGTFATLGGMGLAALMYTCAALGFGYWIFRHYRGKR